MQITTRASGNCTVLELAGRLVMGNDTNELRDAVREATRAKPQKVILNLSKVTYCDSCGIGELISDFTHVTSLGGRLVLTDLPERVRTLLAIARLEPLFEICVSEQEAVANSRQNSYLRQKCG